MGINRDMWRVGKVPGQVDNSLGMEGVEPILEVVKQFQDEVRERVSDLVDAMPEDDRQAFVNRVSVQSIVDRDAEHQPEPVIPPAGIAVYAPTPIEQPAQTIAEIDTERRASEAAHIWFHVVAAAARPFGLEHNAAQADCMAAYFRKHPDAPENSAEIQVRMMLKIELLPWLPEGLRCLCVSLFKQALLGRDGFQRVADAARQAELTAANVPAPRPLHEDERSFHMESGLRDEPSDLAKALAARPATQ